MQQHVVAVASTQSDSPPTHTDLQVSNQTGDNRETSTVGNVESYLTKIARLARQLPEGGPIVTLAESALTDLILDSQTESQLLRDLEIEQTGGQPQGTTPPPQPPTKQARTNNHNPTAAALQHIIDKAQARLASTREHIYISYYDIQRDIDVVLAWLNTFVNNLQHGGATASSSAAIPSADSSTLQAVTGAMPALAGALYGMQHTAGNEHWQNIAEIMMMLQTVHNGGSVSHPANVIAANRGTLTSNLAGERRFNRARGILLELRGISRPARSTQSMQHCLRRWRRLRSSCNPRGRQPCPCRALPRGTKKSPSRPGDDSQTMNGGYKSATTALATLPAQTCEALRKPWRAIAVPPIGDGECMQPLPKTGETERSGTTGPSTRSMASAGD